MAEKAVFPPKIYCPSFLSNCPRLRCGGAARLQPPGPAGRVRTPRRRRGAALSRRRRTRAACRPGPAAPGWARTWLGRQGRRRPPKTEGGLVTEAARLRTAEPEERGRAAPSRPRPRRVHAGQGQTRLVCTRASAPVLRDLALRPAALPTRSSPSQGGAGWGPGRPPRAVSAQGAWLRDRGPGSPGGRECGHSSLESQARARPHVLSRRRLLFL